MFDFNAYSNDNALETAPMGHKHTRDGWIQVECPFCTGNPGYHLGFNESTGFFNCWRCGWHPNLEVIKFFSGVGWEKAKEILQEYETGIGPSIEHTREIAKALSLPMGTTRLKRRHRRYLRSRGFDDRKIEEDWELWATGPIGPYKHRIIAPIYFNRYLVSYQGRDFTNKASLRYKACRLKDEVIHHQQILYGIDHAIHHKAILVEGITDAWRLGHGAVACFGIDMTKNQFLLLMERFTEVFIMFDDDPQAIQKAKDIAGNLSMVGVSTEVCIIEGDPGGLSQTKADRYKVQLLGELYQD